MALVDELRTAIRKDLNIMGIEDIGRDLIAGDPVILRNEYLLRLDGNYSGWRGMRRDETLAAKIDYVKKVLKDFPEVDGISHHERLYDNLPALFYRLKEDDLDRDELLAMKKERALEFSREILRAKDQLAAAKPVMKAYREVILYVA